jgi:ABC-type nitrate/sulfonate/bicarbonate transport system substrate-binding protein
MGQSLARYCREKLDAALKKNPDLVGPFIEALASALDDCQKGHPDKAIQRAIDLHRAAQADPK